jgi:LPS-assembly lipoprotein
MRTLLIALSLLLLTGCGFQLRGTANLPWETLYIGLPENSPLYHQIKRSIESGTHTRIISDPKEAQATLAVLQNNHNKGILSLSAKGLVREFQLTRSFVYRIQDAKGQELIPASQIILQREMNFDDERIFAKEAEEAMIIREMEQDLVVQLLRRLSVSARLVKP